MKTNTTCCEVLLKHLEAMESILKEMKKARFDYKARVDFSGLEMELSGVQKIVEELDIKMSEEI